MPARKVDASELRDLQTLAQEYWPRAATLAKDWLRSPYQTNLSRAAIEAKDWFRAHPPGYDSIVASRQRAYIVESRAEFLGGDGKLIAGFRTPKANPFLDGRWGNIKMVGFDDLCHIDLGCLGIGMVEDIYFIGAKKGMSDMQTYPLKMLYIIGDRGKIRREIVEHPPVYASATADPIHLIARKAERADDTPVVEVMDIGTHPATVV